MIDVIEMNAKISEVLSKEFEPMISTFEEYLRKKYPT